MGRCADIPIKRIIMKQHLLILCSCLLLTMVCVAQTGNEKLTYFNLSVLIEEDEVPSGIFVSVKYEDGGMVMLKGYNGNDAATAKVSEILGYTMSNNFNGYKNVSKSSDSTIENSYQFYNVFTSHSANPRLFGKAIIGKYVLLYVELEEGIPLVVFLLEQNGNSYINYPLMSEHPAITALTDAVNKTYLYPDLFKLQKDIPARKITVSFDSSLQLRNSGFAFYLDVDQVIFNTADNKDTSNVYPGKYKEALGHYRKMLGLLASENIAAFYTGLSPKSATRLDNSFKMSGGAKGNALRFFKNDKTAYSSVMSVADLGSTKLLFVTSPKHQKVKTIRRVYIAPVEDEIKWANENMEFYLDDLWRTNEFRTAVFSTEQ